MIWNEGKSNENNGSPVGLNKRSVCSSLAGNPGILFVGTAMNDARPCPLFAQACGVCRGNINSSSSSISLTLVDTAEISFNPCHAQIPPEMVRNPMEMVGNWIGNGWKTVGNRRKINGKEGKPLRINAKMTGKSNVVFPLQKRGQAERDPSS